MLMNRKTQYCQEVNSPQFILDLKQCQLESQQNICGCCQTYSKDYMERKKAQDGQYNIEGEQTERSKTTLFQDLWLNYSNQDNVELVKE